jgi:Spy/CpxP family protein refolding chaperone
VTKKAYPVALVLALLIGSVLGQAQVVRAAAPSPTTLSDAQKRAIEAIGKDLENKAQLPAVLKLASLAKDYDRNILAEKPDAALEQKLGDELAQTVSQLAAEAVRLRVQAVGEMAKLLTPDQKQLLLAELDKPDANPDLVELIKKVLGDKK